MNISSKFIAEAGLLCAFGLTVARPGAGLILSNGVLFLPISQKG